jgi:hypothetical protein
VNRKSISIVFNLAERPQEIPIRPGTQKILMASEKEISLGNSSLGMSAESVAVLKSVQSPSPARNEDEIRRR